ncbi:MAG TPA: 4'-phosphopantetheinyl transferase superfamily protein [Candidatus Eremiobacteraceae bacterium]|nr:4'-phosphopantetheinyl transferase superfamily protein [Candidatus Eremiobacteraceae bacterium]
MPARVRPHDLRRFAKWLSPSERANLRRLASARLRREYLIAHAFCRATLAKYAGVGPALIWFSAGAGGKPAIVAPKHCDTLRFNLTHTNGLVAVVVSRAGDVGIDAEDVTRRVDVDQIVGHFFSRRAQAQLAGLSVRRRVRRFFAQWVLREAYLKARGKGIAGASERFTIELDDRGRPIPIHAWQLFVHPLSDTHIVGVAVRPRRRGESIVVRWLPVTDFI